MDPIQTHHLIRPDPIQTKHFIPTDPIRTKFKTSIIFGPNLDAAKFAVHGPVCFIFPGPKIIANPPLHTALLRPMAVPMCHFQSFEKNYYLYIVFN
jgi:hypothetical protein